jgi:excisionase family DNA binding protein
MPDVDIKKVVQRAAFWPTIQEAADEWRVSYRTIRLAIERGDIESIRLGKIRVNPDSVERFFASRYSPES